MAAYFENLRSIFRTGGGSGKELESALANGSAVTRVEWRTLPLPGFYGTLGSKHSLLVFSTESGKRYVVEKYRDQTMRKGVFVSEWGEVAPKAPALRLRCNDYDGGDEDGGAGRAPFILHGTQVRPRTTLKGLYDMAVRQSDYDVATCNCHHMAQLLFNHCAAPSRPTARSGCRTASEPWWRGPWVSSSRPRQR